MTVSDKKDKVFRAFNKVKLFNLKTQSNFYIQNVTPVEAEEGFIYFELSTTIGNLSVMKRRNMLMLNFYCPAGGSVGLTFIFRRKEIIFVVKTFTWWC